MENASKSSGRSKCACSTHCTSLGIAKRLPIAKFHIPYALHDALKKNLDEKLHYPILWSKNYIQCINSLSKVKTIKPDQYMVLFKLFIYMEQYEAQAQVNKHNLMDHTMTITSDEFTFQVPTLDEEDPFILPGDTVEIRKKNSRGYYGTITNVMEKFVKVSLFGNSECRLIEEKVDIKFHIKNLPLMCCHYALHILYQNKTVDLIYPNIVDSACLSVKDLDKDLPWVQENVRNNKEQKQAVINILNNSARPSPYIIFGPPGTGKTATLIEAICQIRRKDPSKYILVCTSSNAAADEIAKRLIAVTPSKDIFRIYAPSKNWKEVCKEIVPNSNFIEDTVVYLKKDSFLWKKVIISTLVTCTKLAVLNLKSDHFSYIFIDEASQCIEPETLIPFTLTTELNEANEPTINSQIVIVGDPFQLGPIILSKRIEHLFGKSMLERLMECKAYQKVKGKYNPRYITKLIRNYRSSEPILHIPNEAFYENELLACKVSTNKLILNWPVIKNKTFPIIFFDVAGKEKKCAETHSIYNTDELAFVMQCVDEVLKGKIGNRKIKQSDIGIISPFKLHAKMLRRSLLRKNLRDVTVGTVEVYQGQEKNIIILSTARSRSFVHNGEEHIGFLSQPKRFNVAVTRAKEFLIVIGNSTILCKNNLWKKLWTYCEENNACVKRAEIKSVKDETNKKSTKNLKNIKLQKKKVGKVKNENVPPKNC